MYILRSFLFLTISVGVLPKLMAKNLTDKEKLQYMKHFMIQGETEKAKILSFDLDQENVYSKEIHYHYKAILSFINGDYKDSLRYLAKINQNLENKGKVCQLEIFNLLFLQDSETLEKKWPSCYQSSIAKSKNNLLWLNALVGISTKKTPELTKIPFKDIFIDNQNGDFLNLYLKLALYFNQEELILPRIDKIRDDQFDDEKTRELLAMLYFRNNKLVKAYELIKNLESPSALNILASFFMAQGKKRLAYGKYKLALKQKNTSLNSLERIIPLSIDLGEYKSANDYIQVYNKLEKNTDELKILEAYLAYENKDYKTSSRILRQIENEKLGTQGLYINRLITLTAMKVNDEDLLRKSALKSCVQNSYISCNILAFASHFDDAAKALNEESPQTINEDISAFYSKDIDIKKIDDMIIVNQKDIEAIEDQKIELSKR